MQRKHACQSGTGVPLLFFGGENRQRNRRLRITPEYLVSLPLFFRFSFFFFFSRRSVDPSGFTKFRDLSSARYKFMHLTRHPRRIKRSINARSSSTASPGNAIRAIRKSQFYRCNSISFCHQVSKSANLLILMQKEVNKSVKDAFLKKLAHTTSGWIFISFNFRPTPEKFRKVRFHRVIAGYIKLFITGKLETPNSFLLVLLERMHPRATFGKLNALS